MKLEEIKQELNNIKRTSFGISIPELRKLAFKIAKSNYDSIINNKDFSIYELKLLCAFVIGYIKADITTLLEYFESFMPQVNDWAVNDSLCQNFKITRKYRKEVWVFLERYFETEKEFESRIVAVILLSHFLTDDYIDKVIEVLDKLNTNDYYSQMAVAWALATIMGKYPDKCMEYLTSKNCNLDKITYNKTLQKIRESLKVSKDVKILTKSFKR